MGIGYHINKEIEISEDIKNAEIKYKIDTFQIFVSGPMNMNFNHIKFENIKNKRVYVHSCYVDGIFVSEDYYKFNKSVVDFKLHHKIKEMQCVDKFDGVGLVVHYGLVDIEILKFSLTTLLNMMDFNGIKCHLILEMKASKSNKNSYETAYKYNKLMDMLDSIDVSDRIKMCIDTSHIHAAGILLKTYENAEKYFNSLNLKRLQIIHLNGNVNNLGSGVDQHCKIGSPDDKIWGENVKGAGIEFLVKYATKYNIDIILERHELSLDEVQLVKSLL